MIKKPGIYKITNLINNKIYIGSATLFYKRKNNHYSDLRRGDHGNEHLQNAFNFYGEGNFIFEVLEIIEDKSKLIEREQYYLDILLFASENDKRFNDLGYNICRKAYSLLGTKRTIEQKIKMSKAHLGRPSPIKGIKKLRPAITNVICKIDSIISLI